MKIWLKIDLFITLIGIVVTSIGCGAYPYKAPVVGSLYTNVKAPVTATGLQKDNKVGTASCFSVLGLVAVGDASIEAATRQAGIQSISYIDFQTTSVLGLFATYKIFVYGGIPLTEGRGDISPPKTKVQMNFKTPGKPLFKMEGIGFNLSYSRGNYSKKLYGTEIKGLSSLRWSFFFKNKDDLFYISPQISYAKLQKVQKIKFYNFFEYENEISIRTIPITINVGLNGSKISQLSQMLPTGLNPFATIGIGYYFTQYNLDYSNEWKWLKFGINYGLGIEYFLNPKSSVIIGFNKHSVFTDEPDYDYWDWNIGFVYYLGE